MSTSSFRIVEHQIPCQYIREYPRALAGSQEDTLHLSVKQYIPLSNPNPQPGDVTIIAAHANGFPKELYEPLWEDLLSLTSSSSASSSASTSTYNFRIRAIWMADVAHQNASGVLNESLLGNDPCWTDHARDLLHLINVKREEMPRPLIGIGHSMGGNSVVNLAYIHPRLLTSLVLLDPVVQISSAEFDTDLSSPAAPPPPYPAAMPANSRQEKEKKTNDDQEGRPQAGQNEKEKSSSSPPSVARLSTFRRDVWPSRKAAAETFRSSPFYQRWDSRVLDRWIEYGLRDMPTLLHPGTNAFDTSSPFSSSSPTPAVTLTTTAAQEVFTFLRPNYAAYGYAGRPINRDTHADVDPTIPGVYPFYRPEPPATFGRLPSLRPSVLYVFGGESNLGTPASNAAKLATTGVGVGGSGGRAEGRVKGIELDGVGHLIAMECPRETAVLAYEWMGSELDRWKRSEEEFRRDWNKKTLREKQGVDEQWKKKIGGPLLKTGGAGKRKGTGKGDGGTDVAMTGQRKKDGSKL